MTTKRARHAALAALCLGALLMPAGCKSYLAFGTATTFGLDASQRADQTVDITMGYRRIEIASIPVQEVKEKPATSSDSNAAVGADAKGDTTTPDASHTGDAYSVLGSFRVHYGNPFTSGLTLNQLFATGMAARAVAENTDMQEYFGKAAAKAATGEGVDQ